MMTRRQFVGAAAAMGLAPLPKAWPSAGPAKDASTPVPFDGNQRVEHYVLLGNRMVFTNWYFVRPGNVDWVDASGKSVYASKEAMGPWAARFAGKDFPHGVRIVAQPAQRQGPIIHPERPWEKSGIVFGTVIHEGGTYRAWGNCYAGVEGVSAYFESRDGLNWTRPNLGLQEHNGSRANNLLHTPPGGGVWIDPHAAPGEKYKTAGSHRYTKAQYETWLKSHPGQVDPMVQDNHDLSAYHGISGSTSADGLHWKRLPEPLVFQYSDTQIVGYYDLRRRQYVLYTRAYMGAGPSHRRAVGRTQSEEFGNFPISDLILETAPSMGPCDTLYTNCRTTIPGAPDHHLMFPAVYELQVDSTQIAFASSHDGVIWSFVPGSPIASPGTFGEWDGGNMFAFSNLLELADGSFVLPFTGFIFPHKYPRGEWEMGSGYLTWPKGRLVAIEAPDVGEFSTVGFLPPGRKVLINALTPRAGEIRVEVATDPEGKTVAGRSFEECKPLIGDCYKTPITWNGQEDLGSREGTPVILRFRLDHAQIFGLEFV